jgi:DNA-binding transcriptional ArsR family regulator
MAGEQTFGRRITDTQALRALAHTARYAMLEHLQVSGPATATECAALVGLSPSACSYHLRLLARHGFIEPAEESSDDGRERRWRAVTAGWQSDPDDTDPAARAADATLARVLLADSQAKALAWLDASPREPREWRDAALASNSTIVATAEELAGISRALMAVLSPYLQSRRSLDDAPAGARQIHVALRMAPRTG